MAPWVETSLYIHRAPMSGVPAVMDFAKEFYHVRGLTLDDEHGGVPGTARPSA